jgi:hypothetical protein
MKLSLSRMPHPAPIDAFEDAVDVVLELDSSAGAVAQRQKLRHLQAERFEELVGLLRIDPLLELG